MTPIMRQILFSGGPRGNSFARALGSRLKAGILPACILAQGDSTGNDTTEWVYKAAEWLGTKYPAYNFIYRPWSGTNECYLDSTYIQTGINGGGYAQLNGTSGKCIYIADSAAVDITGDIDLIVKVALDDWSLDAGKSLLAKWGAGGNRSWYFYLTAANVLGLYTSADGTANAVDLTSAVSLTSELVNGQAKWFRVTLDVDNGASGHTVKFYKSDDGATWTQTGTDKVGAGATSIFASAKGIELGTSGSGAALLWPGKFYQGIIKNGIDGTTVASPDFSMAFPSTITAFKDVEGNAITNYAGDITVGNGSPGVLVLNSCYGGAEISYSIDATRFAKQAAYEPQLAFIDYGHNETTGVGYGTTYLGLCTQLRTAWPNVGVVGIKQNPQVTPRTAEQIALQDSIQTQIEQAMRSNNYGFVDVYDAFIKTGNVAGYLGADGLHPTLTGNGLYTNEVKKFLLPAVK